MFKVDPVMLCVARAATAAAAKPQKRENQKNAAPAPYLTNEFSKRNRFLPVPKRTSTTSASSTITRKGNDHLTYGQRVIMG